MVRRVFMPENLMGVKQPTEILTIQQNILQPVMYCL